MNTQGTIRQISAKETLSLRHKVLKPHLSIEECANPEDIEPSTFHLGLYFKDHLVSIVSFSYQACPLMSAGAPYRLRGMATDEKYRSQGFGNELVNFAQDLLRSKRCDLIWCNARIKAIPFYENLGFRGLGNLFELPGIGTHKVMYKILNPR